MKVRILTTGRQVSLDIENQAVAEAVFSRLTITLLEIMEGYEKKTADEDWKRKEALEMFLENREEEETSGLTYKGFLYIKCPECGTAKGFNSRNGLSGYRCSECGAYTPFTEALKELYVNCECGDRFKYMTNMEEPLFDIQCLNCGNPVAVKWNDKRERYETMR